MYAATSAPVPYDFRRNARTISAPRVPAAFVEDPSRLHQQLARLNRTRLTPGLPDETWRDAVREEGALRIIEGEYIERERAAVAPWVSDMPTTEDGFLAWFEALEVEGPGQHDPLFDHLAEHAPIEQMRWFLLQEVAGEAGFEDLVAATQIRMPSRAKLELARNYWDEMGRGRPDGMHGPMLGRLSRTLALDPTIESTVWESLALSNLLAGFASNRRYAFHSIGALGAVELTAPGRAAKVAAGLKRLNVETHVRQYFDLHAVLDVKHSESWNAEVIRPLIAEDPRRMRAIAEGAVMRLRAGARCFDRYRRAFGWA